MDMVPDADGTLVAKRRGISIGTLGRATATAFIGQFIANQLINYYTRGTPTWENPEEGFEAKISAWIPDKLGKSSGFFLNPMTLPLEMSHLFLKGYHRTGSAAESALAAVSSRFSSLSRFLETLYTGHDNEGNVANGTADRIGLAAKTAAPTPISGGAIYRFGKQLVTGEPEEKYPRQFQRQAMQTFGIKPDAAPSPEQRIYRLAEEFNRAHGIKERPRNFDRPFATLDNALKTGNMTTARRELDAMMKERKAKQILERYHDRITDAFTGKADREREFLATLTPEQRQQYDAARDERKRIAEEVKNLLKQ